MGKATVAFCDMCQARDGAVTNYEIKFPTGKLIVDLCAEHGEALELIRKQCSSLFVSFDGKAGRRRSRVVVDPTAL